MANEPTLVAEKRERTGSAECRRLRREGMTPGNLYGHGITGIPLKVASDALNTVIHSGSHLVRLDLAGKTETALFQEVQWDTFGVRIEHFDLLRVDLSEEVSVEVEVHLVGTPEGVINGGVLEQPVHTLHLVCRAGDVPDSFEVRVQHLQIGDTLTVGDLEFPEGATCQFPDDQVVVLIHEPVVEEEEDGEAAEGGEEPAES
ncbi:MAG: 50S ribosomal protein L25 [Planctomycetaceae bacterium]|nr:50S ribosomal protein L25 [Planctomycetaceae bacterium]